MNALMTIQVRVLSAQALAQLRAVEAQSKRTAVSGIGGMSRAAQYGIPQLSKWGNQVQWAGRQLQYNFTLPIALAIGMATKFALENEAAMVRVRKVYGDMSMDAQVVTNEVNALSDAFEALSNQFGIHQKEVIAIAGDWAAAGASGIALAKATKLTLETMVLGEIGAEEATRNLIAIQAQYGQNTKELTKTIEILNMVENQTGTTMADLMNGLARAAGTAREAGVDIRHLTAMVAALTPAAGSAATAGNGLKTIISRILQPTGQAAEVMKVLGLNMDNEAVASLNATQRLELMAESYDKLSGAGKVYASSVIASRWQVNRFAVLMRALNNENSYYNKALRSTTNAQDLFNQKQKELTQVLESNPQKMKQAGVILQNSLADVIVPLLPLIVYLAQEVARLAHWFSQLEGETQKLVLALALFLAVIGPIARYVGSVANLFGLLSAASHWFAVQMGLVAVETELADGSIRRSRRGLVGLLRLMTVAPIMGFVNALAAMGGGLVSLGGKVLGYAKKTLLITASAAEAETAINAARVASVTTAATATVTAEETAAAARLRATVAGGAARVTEERVWQTAQIAALTSGSVARTAEEEAEQLRRTFFVDSGGTARSLAETAEQTQRIFIVNGAGETRAAFERAEQMQRIFVVETGGTVRIGLEAMHQEMQTALVAAGARARVIASQTGIAPMLAIEAAKHTEILALQAGASSRMLALQAGTSAVSTGIAAQQAAAIIAINQAQAVGVYKTHLKMTLAIRGLWARLMAFIAGINLAMVAIWAAAAIAIVAVIYVLRDDIARIFGSAVDYVQDVIVPGIVQAFEPLAPFFESIINFIVDMFWKLPDGIRNALLTVVTMIRDAALQVYEWFSYLNPFAHHSPSLVESVTRGMDVIMAQYGRAKNVGSVYAQAAKDLAAFKRVSASMGQGEWSDERVAVRKAMPNSIPLFNSLVNDLGRLNPLMNRQEAAVNAQQAVVDRWASRLDRANQKLDDEQAILDRLQARLRSVQDQYDAHADALRNFAESPLEGMGKFNDAIFQNELAQKKLQLQMAKWKEANGDVDDMRSRLDLLRGDIETLSGQANDLRMAGAGSDILGPIQQQIAAMEAQAKATTDAINNSPVDKMAQQLEELQRQGEILQLEYDVQFDPLTNAIQKLADTQKELSYDDIVAGIKSQQDAMATLQPKIDELNAAMLLQQTNVDAATKARDRLQTRYDAEQKALDALNDRYQETQDLVRDIESALRDMGSAATDAIQKAKDAAAGKDGVKIPGGKFPEVGGKNAIGREGGLGDQSDLINQFTQDTIDDMNKIFGDFDMFAPIKRWWNKTWTWVKNNVGPVVMPIVNSIGDAVGDLFDRIGSGGGGGAKLKSFADKFSDFFDVIVDVIRTGARWIRKGWKLIAPDMQRIGEALVEFAQNLWHEVGPELVKFKDLLEPLGKAVKNVWRVLKPLLGVVLLGLAAQLKQTFSMLGHLLDPVLDMLVGTLKGTIRVFRGFIEIVLGVLTLDWQLAWDGIKDVVGGTFDQIWAIIKGAGRIILGVVEGFIGGIIGFFKWLYDVLVGHSIVPDMVKAIIKWFKVLALVPKWIWNNVLKPLYRVFKEIWTDWLRPYLSTWWSLIKGVFSIIKGLAGWWWDNVLKPVFNKVRQIWTEHIRPELSEWFGRFKNVWDNLTKLAGWIKDNVMDPVFSAFKTGWKAIKKWFEDNGGLILNPIKSVVQGIVSAINWIIKGLNKLDELPGVSISISEINLPDEFAQGGIPRRRVGNGFITSGARAIVGEGKANYPEYVIPTDPTYRHRAQSLLKAAGERLGMTAIPMHEDGGILGGLKDVVGGVVNLGQAAWSSVKDAGKFAMSTAMEPFFKLAEAATEKIDWSIGRQIANGGINVVREWIKGVSQEYKDQYGNLASANVPQGGMQGGLTAFMQGVMPLLGGTLTGNHGAGYYGALFAGDFNSPNDLANPPSPVVAWKAGTVASVTPGSTSYGNHVYINHPGGLNSLYAHLSSFATSAGNNVRAGQMIGRVGATGRAYGAHLHFEIDDSAMAQGGRIALKYGAIVQASRGGTDVTVGEGGRDEAVIPLPRDWRRDAFNPSGSGDTITMNFYGPLEFPNIKNGDDAQTFVDNLVILAKD